MIQATEGSSAATIGATSPPSLCPINPILEGSIPSSVLAKANADFTSFAKSSVVAVGKFPLDFPTPRSSYRKTAIPRLDRWSAITQNGL